MMPSGRARPHAKAGALLAVTALMVTACGEDDNATVGETATTVASTDAAPTSPAPATTTAPTSTAPATTAAPSPTTAEAEGDEAAQGPAIAAFVATDFAFDVPAQVPAGVVELSLENAAGEDHQLSLYRLGEGQNPDDVVAALHANDLSFAAQGTFVGGPNGVTSGETGTVVSEVAPGTYLAFCAIPSPSDGVPHHHKGMVASFEVTGDGSSAGQLPDADGEITIGADGYQVPAGFDGSGQFTVANNAPFPAELTLFRLQEGRTQDDLIAFLGGSAPPGPPPFVPGVGGGVTALSPGDSSVATFDLAPGSYVFLSFVPDPGAGFAPQFTNGLITTVEVSA